MRTYQTTNQIPINLFVSILYALCHFPKKNNIQIQLNKQTNKFPMSCDPISYTEIYGGHKGCDLNIKFLIYVYIANLPYIYTFWKDLVSFYTYVWEFLVLAVYPSYTLQQRHKCRYASIRQNDKCNVSLIIFDVQF